MWILCDHLGYTWRRCVPSPPGPVLCGTCHIGVFSDPGERKSYANSRCIKSLFVKPFEQHLIVKTRVLAPQSQNIGRSNVLWSLFCGAIITIGIRVWSTKYLHFSRCGIGNTLHAHYLSAFQIRNSYGKQEDLLYRRRLCRRPHNGDDRPSVPGN